MNIKSATLLITGSIFLAIIAAQLHKHIRAVDKPVVLASSASATPSASPAPVTPPGNPLAVEPAAPVPPASVPEVAPMKPNKTSSQKGQAGKGKEPIQDPTARQALGFVGVDPEAEQYWVSAINDPSLPPDERKDLIEDLNEDGLSDPKQPGPQDVPLIVNRLRLIEALAPLAMDQVNADAFAEAYKDLKNLLAGQPVR